VTKNSLSKGSARVGAFFEDGESAVEMSRFTKKLDYVKSKKKKKKKKKEDYVSKSCTNVRMLTFVYTRLALLL